METVMIRNPRTRRALAIFLILPLEHAFVPLVGVDFRFSGLIALSKPEYDNFTGNILTDDWVKQTLSTCW
jgi:hypothetical protein